MVSERSTRNFGTSYQDSKHFKGRESDYDDELLFAEELYTDSTEEQQSNADTKVIMDTRLSVWKVRMRARRQTVRGELWYEAMRIE